MRKAPENLEKGSKVIEIFEQFPALTAAILVGDIGKAPDVAQADGHRDAGEEKLDAVCPFTTMFSAASFC